MRSTRVIPVILLDGKRAVKTKQFLNPTYVGDPINIVRLFSEKFVDELIILDITATSKNLNPDKNFLQNLAAQAFMPLAFGGNIKSLGQAKTVFEVGMEKVVLGSAALINPKLISEISNEFGSQAVCVCLDILHLEGDKIHLKVTGRDNPEIHSLIELTNNLQELGVGEIIVQSVLNDSMLSGYNLQHIKSISKTLKVPLVALGGCNGINNMVEAIHSGASAVAAGTLFTFIGEHRAVLINYPDLSTLEEFIP